MAAGSDLRRVLESVDLVDLVGEYVRLVKAGRTYKGVCPFHPDSKPSLTVSPERQLWYCFGCHEGGSAFQFLMKAENLSFGEALRELAHRGGVALAGVADVGEDQRREIVGLNEQAAAFYRSCLASKGGEGFLRYVRERGISARSVEQFELGCTPASGSGLFEHLVHKGAKAEALVRAGLSLRSEVDGGFFDRFRGRVMFPIRDASGRLVGFGGRALGEAEPKYLNSPETVVFSKGGLLYGLHLAKGEMSRSGKAILVEGYTDVIACFQAGIENVVATLGTALGERHVALLRRYVGTVVVAYDSDSSGFQAMIRGSSLLEGGGMVLRVARFAGGGDPDEVLRRGGRAAFEAAVEGALPATDFRLEMALAEYDGRDPEGRLESSGRVAEILSGIRNPIEQGHYISECAARMSAGEPGRAKNLEEALLAQVRQGRSKGSNDMAEQRVALESALEGVPRGVVEAERAVLWAIFSQPQLVLELATTLSAADFSHPEHRTIAERLLSDPNGPAAAAEWASEGDGALSGLLAKVALSGERIHSVNEREVIEGYVKTITDFRKRQRWSELQQEAVRCLKEGKDAKAAEVFTEYRQLTRYLMGSSDRQTDTRR